MKDADGKKLFKDLRTAMGIKSQKGFGVQMKPIMSLEDFEKQELRQEYIEENIFEIGDYVENMNDCSIGKIIKRELTISYMKWKTVELRKFGYMNVVICR